MKNLTKYSHVLDGAFHSTSSASDLYRQLLLVAEAGITIENYGKIFRILDSQNTLL